MATTSEQYKLVAQLGLLEGIKAGLLQPSPDSSAAISSLTAVTTPDATDEATAITLANALKVKVNAIIAALKA